MGNSEILAKEFSFVRLPKQGSWIGRILPRKWNLDFNEGNSFHSYIFPLIYYLLPYYLLLITYYFLISFLTYYLLRYYFLILISHRKGAYAWKATTSSPVGPKLILDEMAAPVPEIMDTFA
jgi:hypothetical protein